jgi:hypothetical protein
MENRSLDKSMDVKSNVEDILNRVVRENQRYGKAFDQRNVNSNSKVTLPSMETTSATHLTSIIHSLADLKLAMNLIFGQSIQTPEPESKSSDQASAVSSLAAGSSINYSNRQIPEEYSYLVFNICKLIYDISRPLIWIGCGKHVIDSLIYASIAMEAVINLTTVQYLRFRWKLFALAIYASVEQEGFKQAGSILSYAATKVQEVKQREEIDSPVPTEILSVITECELDLAVMRASLSFFLNKEFFYLSNTIGQSFKAPNLESLELTADSRKMLTEKSFCERVISELCRILYVGSSRLNESWKKQSVNLINAIWKYSTDETEIALSTDCLSEISVLMVDFSLSADSSLNDLLDEDVDKMLQSVWNMANNHLEDRDQESSGYASLRVLEIVYPLIQASSSTSWLAIDDLNRLSSLVDQVMSDDTNRMSRISFFRKFALSLWTKYIFGILQRALSNAESESQNLKKLLPYISLSVKCLDYALCDDAVLLASLYVTTTLLLKQTGDYRSAISLSKRGLDYIDNQRAILVDLRFYNTDDQNDLYSLQKASFTMNRDIADWFQSKNRPGAINQASYGLFGAGALSDYISKALSEVHTELLCVYFRCELEYGISQYNHRVHRSMQASSKVPAMETTFCSKTKDKHSSSKKDTSNQSNHDRQLSSVDSLSTLMTSLKAFCCKNQYLLALLHIEMAKAEAQFSPIRAFEFLKESRDYIIEAETRESALKDSFLVDSDTMFLNRQYPIVLSRSHKFIYVSPCFSFSELEYYDINSLSYRIIVKDYGSGTSISLRNAGNQGMARSEYDGSNELVTVLSPSTLYPIRISSLRSGESYVFGSVASSSGSNENIDSSLSKTSPMVEALNPLPTSALWSLLSLASSDILLNNLSSFQIFETTSKILTPTAFVQLSVKRVIDRYFVYQSNALIASDSSSQLEEIMKRGNRVIPLSLGNGINVNIGAEPRMNTLAIEQSSVYELEQLVKCYIIYIDTVTSSIPNDTIDIPIWKNQSSAQDMLFHHLQRLSVIALIASYIKKQELCIDVVTKASNLLTIAIRYNEASLAKLTQPIVSTLITSLQSFPMKYWSDLEFNVYCQLFAIICRAAYINKSLPILTPLFDRFIISSEAVPLSDHTKAKILGIYEITLRLGGGVILPYTSKFIESLTKVFLAEVASDVSLWAMSLPTRTFFLKTKLNEITAHLLDCQPNPPVAVQQVDKQLKELPPKMSDLLIVANILIQNGVNSGSAPGRVNNLCKLFPLYDRYLSVPLQDLAKAWKLDFIKIYVENVEVVEASAKTKKSAAKSNTLSEKPSAVPDRFIHTNDEEMSLQSRCLAEITSAIATIGLRSQQVASISKADKGPFDVIETAELDVDAIVNTLVCKAIAVNMDAAHQNDASNELAATFASESLSQADGLRYLFASFEMFILSNSISSAVTVAVRIWTYLIDNWSKPITLLDLFKEFSVGLQLHVVHRFVKNLHQLISLITTSIYSYARKDAQPTIEEYCPRTLKQYLISLRDVTWYALYSLFLLDQYEDFVSMGMEILEMFVNVSLPDGVDALYNQCKYYGDRYLPLMIFAQSKLIIASKRKILNHHEEVLSSFVKNYELEQSKKRKKKKRITRIEKDEEQILFEEQRDVYTNIVMEAEKNLKESERLLDELMMKEKAYQSYYAIGYMLFDKVNQVNNDFLMDCKRILATSSTDGSKAFASTLEDCIEMNPELFDRYVKLIAQFNKLVDYLRERKLKALLLQSLNIYSDLLLRFLACNSSNRRVLDSFGDRNSRLRKIRNICHDAIDGVFSCLDSHDESNWLKITEGLDNKFKTSSVASEKGNQIEEQLSCMITVIIILGKLIRHCSICDYDQKLQYSRMAAKICLYLYRYDGLTHPWQLHRFAAYIYPQEVGGYLATRIRYEFISSQALCIATDEVIKALQEHDEHLEALPLFTIMEYYHGAITRNPEQWLRIRMIRIRSLIELRFFAEAVSMLSGIKQSLLSIARRSFENPLQIQRGNSASKNSNLVEEAKLSSNGLEFQGIPEYFNNHAPSSPENLDAVNAIMGYPDSFRSFANAFTLSKPALMLSAADGQRIELWRTITSSDKPVDQTKKASDKTKATPISPKGSKKPAGSKATPGGDSPTAIVDVQILPASADATISTICMKLLLALLSLQGNNIPSFSSSIFETIKNRVASTISLHIHPDGESFLSNPTSVDSLQQVEYLEVFSLNMISKLELLLLQKRWNESRSLSLKLLDFFSSYQCNDPDARGILTVCWIRLKYHLISVSRIQGRYEEALELCNRLSAQEITINLFGHWMKKVLLQRCEVFLVLNQYNSAERDCDFLIHSYTSRAISHPDLGYCDALLIRAKLLQIKMKLSCRGSVMDMGFRVFDILSLARDIAMKIAFTQGFLGCENHMTSMLSLESASSSNSSIIRDQSFLPWQQQFIHDFSDRNHVLSATHYQERDAKVESGYANNSLVAVQVLITIDANLCMIIDEIISSNYFDMNKSRPLEEDDEQKDGNRDNDIHAVELVQNRDYFADIYLQRCVEGFQLLKYSYYTTEISRVHLIIAYTKLLSMNKEGQQPIFGEEFMQPLAIAFASMSVSCHDWYSMRQLCVQLIECYGNNTIPWKDASTIPEESPLKATVRIMQLALKITTICRCFEKLTNVNDISKAEAIISQLVNLSAEEQATLQSKLPDEVCVLMNELQGNVKPMIVEQVVAAVKDSKKGKNQALKENGKSKDNSVDSAQDIIPTVIDSLMMIAYLLYDINRTKLSWEDSSTGTAGAADALQSLHSLLVKHSVLYKAKFFVDLPSALSAESTLTVTSSSISILWSQIPSPVSFQGGALSRVLGFDTVNGSLYQHLSAYFLLGSSQKIVPLSVAPNTSMPSTKHGKSTKTLPLASPQGISKNKGKSQIPSNSVIEDPILTKLVIYRPDMNFILMQLQALINQQQAISPEEQNLSMDIAKAFGSILMLVVELFSSGYIDIPIDPSKQKKYKEMSVIDIANSLSNPRGKMSLARAEEDEYAAGVLGSTSPGIAILIALPSKNQEPTNENSTINCYIPCNIAAMRNLESVLQSDFDVNNVIDNSLCILLRTVISYGLKA